jgi:nicotinamide phosphoribosyltransferase
MPTLTRRLTGRSNIRAFESSYSYIEARKGGAFNEVMFFGLQYVLRYYLTQRVTKSMIDEAEEELTLHGVPFNRPEWEYIVEKHGGFLPIRVSALPEGVVVPHGTVLVTVESLDPKCAGLAAYVETLLQRGVWFPSTIATRSMRWFRLIERYMKDTGTPELTALEDGGLRGSRRLLNRERWSRRHGSSGELHRHR